MDTSNVTLTLLTSIAVLGLLSAAVWLLVGLMLRIAPTAATRFALANGLLVLGAMITGERLIADTVGAAIAGSIATLTGLVVMRAGVQRLHRLPRTVKENVAVLIVVAVVIVVGRGLPRFLDLARLALALGMVWICFRTVFESAPTLKRDYGRLAAVLMTLPFIALGVLLAARVVRWWMTGGPAQPAASLLSSQSVPALWGFVALIVMGNSAIIGMTLGRLLLRIRSLGARDMLTGALSRRELESRLGKEHARARRNGQMLSLLICDFDHFKAINDRYGHAAGDAVLRSLVAVMKSALRQPDLIGRYGGEEFVVILPITDESGAIDTAERLRAAVEASPVPWPDGPIAVTASIGVATVLDDDPQTALRAADAALYRAKQGGRNRVEVAGRTAPGDAA